MATLDRTNLSPEARFWNRIAARYAKKPVPDQQVYETKLAKTDSQLKAADNVLEIGCGTGTTAIHHAPKVSRFRATDISEGMIEIAKAKACDAGVSNIDFEVTSIDALNADAQTYDVILAHSILHLLPNVDLVLRQLHAILRPGGRLISSTSCIRDFMPLFRYIVPLGRKLGIMPYVNVFGAEDLQRWLSDTGFVIKESWRPSRKTGIYVVACKPGSSA